MASLAFCSACSVASSSMIMLGWMQVRSTVGRIFCVSDTSTLYPTICRIVLMDWVTCPSRMVVFSEFSTATVTVATISSKAVVSTLSSVLT